MTKDLIILIALIIICVVCLILIIIGIQEDIKEEGRQHRRELHKIWTGHYPEDEKKTVVTPKRKNDEEEKENA